MTATERLRQLLDKRGVEWRYDYELHYVEWANGSTVLTALPMENGNVAVQAIDEMTPEQAVEATLGRGTCKMKRVEDEQRILHGWLECSECGPVYPPVSDGIAQAVAFCPFCGRRVVE